MSGRTLDVSKLPFVREFVCKNGSTIDIAELFTKHRPVIDQLIAAGLVEQNESFGFAMCPPEWDGYSWETSEEWDDPDKFVWFVGGWGPDRDARIADAVRMLRALLRRDFNWSSTLDLRFYANSLFLNEVESVAPDGTFQWGDFARGGASKLTMGDLTLRGAASAYSEVENDTVANLILGSYAKAILTCEGRLPED